MHDNPPTPHDPPAPTRRQWAVYLTLVVAAVALFVVVIGVYRRQMDRYQYGRPRYAAERAIDALSKGDRDGAAREVALLATERPKGVREGLIFTRQFSDVEEGPVLRNRVMTYERLTGELLKAGMLPEAEEVAWKALLEYHIASRPFEMLIPWNLLYHVKLAREDWTSAIECLKIQAAHGLVRIETPDKLLPESFAFDRAVIAGPGRKLPGSFVQPFKSYYESEAAYEFISAARLMDGLDQPTLIAQARWRAREFRHRALLQSGQALEARQLLAEVWGRDPAVMGAFWSAWPTQMPTMNLADRDPTLLDYLWRDRPADSKVGVGSFVDSFSVDARVQIEDLRGMKKFETGYFQPENEIMHLQDSVLFFQNVGATLDVTVEHPVYRIFLAFQSTVVLGVHPILLVRIDDQPMIPVYCDSSAPALTPLDVNLAAGAHRFEFIYLNDASFAWPAREIDENRNLALSRMVLVHVQPRE